MNNGNDVSGVANYTNKIREWAKERNIIGGGSSSIDQFIKGLTESGELWGNTLKGNTAKLKDDIGDIYVCLTNATGILGINLEDYAESLFARHPTAGASNYAVNGPKRHSLQLLYTLSAASQWIERITDATDRDEIKKLKEGFCEACLDILYVLTTIAQENGWTMMDCIKEAYNDIKDRKGVMYNGAFVKERDFTVPFVMQLIRDDNHGKATPYLSDWLRKNPFWEVWGAAQGDNNVAPFAVSEAAVDMMGKAKEGELTVVLGRFGEVTANGRVYIIDEQLLHDSLANLIGKQVGEMGAKPAVCGGDLNEYSKIIHNVNPINSAGVLTNCVITKTPGGIGGDELEVIGLIKPSDRFKDAVFAGDKLNFAIRGISTNKTADGHHVDEVVDLVCFDVVK